MLKKLISLMSKHPVKIVLFTVMAIVLLAAGARNVQMATGNETLVSSESRVYIDNQELEKEFGGESIIIVYEGIDDKVLTVDRLGHMKKLETILNTHEEVYSVMSPVVLIEEMSSKQADKYKDGLVEVSDGLYKMGEKLIEIGEQMEANASEGSQLSSVEGQMSELNQGLNNMVQGQMKLKEGTISLVNGYSQFGSYTKEAGLKLGALASKYNTDDLQAKQQADQINKISTQLIQLSEKMLLGAERSAALPNVSEQTIKGLKGIESGLSNQQRQLEKLQAEKEKQAKDLNELSNGLMEMGTKLVSISENLTTMHGYSDTLKPGLPEKQETLEHMVYDENGKKRDIFNEVLIDDHTMIMMVKFNGNVSDGVKSEVSQTVKSYLNENQIDSTEMMVSGKPVLDDAIRSSMKESMQKMMMLSILFMVIILFFSFNVSWRLLPLGVILIAVIGTVGLMGWIQIPITMVSMAVFPILIGLGIDYAIQFQNRYSEELAEEEGDHE
ncbi:MMPL family transporter [Mesobacillus jeotgali]|uniref:MMPL family transporter n=1 Tax=Mesobacillus jeotgali TaxID=129985 RepID=UPI001CFC7453|nr:MMPL family transporter [Mesobacillus jeotgali]